MKFMVHDPYIDPSLVKSHGVESVTLDELLAKSDYVSVHCPLNQKTYHLIDERELHLMQRHAFFVNTARGKIVVEKALIKALKEGWISGAGLDVLEQEPPDPEHPLLKMGNVIITPHFGGNSDRPDALFEASVETIIDLANGRWPVSVVNPQVKPRCRWLQELIQTK